MDNSEVLHIAQGGEQLNSEASNQAILEALVVIHLDKLVEVDAIEIKDAAQVVSEDEVVAELHHPLDVVWVAFFEQEK